MEPLPQNNVTESALCCLELGYIDLGINNSINYFSKDGNIGPYLRFYTVLFFKVPTK